MLLVGWVHGAKKVLVLAAFVALDASGHHRDSPFAAPAPLALTAISRALQLNLPVRNAHLAAFQRFLELLALKRATNVQLADGLRFLALRNVMGVQLDE